MTIRLLCDAGKFPDLECRGEGLRLVDGTSSGAHLEQT